MGTQRETSMDTRFDGLFATVAEQAGGIEPLFDYFFGFLCRKTDFFTVGRAACKEMLDKSFQKWTEKAMEKTERERLQREKKQLHQRQQEEQRKQEQQRKQPVDLENRPKIEELTEDEEALYSQPADKGAEKSSQQKSSPAKTDQNAQQEEPAGSDDEQSARRPEGNGGTTDKWAELNTHGKSVSWLAFCLSRGGTESREDGRNICRSYCRHASVHVAVLCVFCVALSANCLRRRYRWTQTLESVDVYVPVGTGVRAAQCSVKVTGSRLTVGLKGQPPILGKEKASRRVTACFVHAAVFSFKSTSIFAPNFVRVGRADKHRLFSFVLHRYER